MLKMYLLVSFFCCSSFPPGIHSPYTYSLLIVVFFQVLFQSIWNGKHVNAIIGGAAAYGRSADVLQGEGLCAVDGVGQQGLEEHAGVGVLVVLQQTCNCGSMEDTGVVHVEAKIVVPLFNACM